MAIICIQIGALLTVCCRAGTHENGTVSGTDIPGMQQKLVRMKRQEKALQNEYSLARASTPYLIVHASNGIIELKARGRILRTFKVKEISEWETGTDGDEIWTLTEIKPIQRAERPKIKPGAGEETTTDAAKKNLWGLHRMPFDYDLVCSGENILQIRGLPSDQSGLGIAQSLKSLYRRSMDWYRRRSAAENPDLQRPIRLWLDENDSRLIFWSLPKQIKILVLSQSDPPSVSS